MFRAFRGDQARVFLYCVSRVHDPRSVQKKIVRSMTQHLPPDSRKVHV